MSEDQMMFESLSKTGLFGKFGVPGGTCLVICGPSPFKFYLDLCGGPLKGGTRILIATEYENPVEFQALADILQLQIGSPQSRG